MSPQVFIRRRLRLSVGGVACVPTTLHRNYVTTERPPGKQHPGALVSAIPGLWPSLCGDPSCGVHQLTGSKGSTKGFQACQRGPRIYINHLCFGNSYSNLPGDHMSKPSESSCHKSSCFSFSHLPRQSLLHGRSPSLPLSREFFTFPPEPKCLS